MIDLVSGMVPATDDKVLTFNGGIIWKVQAGLGATSGNMKCREVTTQGPKGGREKRVSVEFSKTVGGPWVQSRRGGQLRRAASARILQGIW